jgi:hypothetical protein
MPDGPFLTGAEPGVRIGNAGSKERHGTGWLVTQASISPTACVAWLRGLLPDSPQMPPIKGMTFLRRADQFVEAWFDNVVSHWDFRGDWTKGSSDTSGQKVKTHHKSSTPRIVVQSSQRL